MIRAETHTSDNTYWINFDATPWFENATQKEILDLYDCDWSDCRAANGIVEWFHKVSLEPEISRMLRYIQQRAGTSAATKFECYVSGMDATAWLDQNRPGWRQAVNKGRVVATPVERVCGRCKSVSTGGVYCPNGCGRI